MGGDIIGIEGDILGGVAFQSPLSLAGLDGWWDASSIIAADGTAIGTWPDLSGLGHNLIQATAAQQPLLKLSIVNAHSVLRFDGVNDFMQAVISTANVRTLFAVLKKATAPAAERTGWATIPSDRDKLITNSGVSATNWGKYSNQGGATIAIGAVALAWNLLIFNYQSLASLAMFVNGVAQAAYDPFDDYATQTGLRVGTNAAASNFADEDVAEVLEYSRSLSSDEMNAVAGYLNQKYSVY